MIVWIASYPRSGNTLLRTILKRCMGLDSFTDEEIHVDSPIRSDSALIGHRELTQPWDEFYEWASRAREIIPVKTHLPPRDSQPYLYVVRDGRLAIRSYRKYYESYVPGHRPSLYQLILGDDAYGDWTAHYRAWTGQRQASGMILRFEELLEVGLERVQDIASFVGYPGAVEAWVNPVESLARAEPAFFGAGAARFEEAEDWPELAERVFQNIHGALLAELGYEQVVQHEPLTAEGAVFLEWTRGLVERNRVLAHASAERLALIHHLSEEAQRRLDIIHGMQASRRSG